MFGSINKNRCVEHADSCGFSPFRFEHSASCLCLLQKKRLAIAKNRQPLVFKLSWLNSCKQRVLVTVFSGVCEYPKIYPWGWVYQL